MITAVATGTFQKTMKFLHFMQGGRLMMRLDHYGQQGVDALSRATPRDSGVTAQSWGYQIGYTHGKYAISWFNTHKHNGVNIAIIIQYGHGTGTGGWVEGFDYINPAIRPIFDRIAEDIWREVRNA